MLSLLNSQERTLPQFIDIGLVRMPVSNVSFLTRLHRARSGFEFVKLWDLGEVGLMEFAPSVSAYP